MKVALDNIRVAVIFGQDGKVVPVWFELNRHKHTIKDIAYIWKSRVGDTPYMHFSVTDGSVLYELVYNMKGSTWRLEQLEA